MPAPFKLFLQWKVDPPRIQIDGGVGDSVLDHAGKSYGDAVEFRQTRTELIEDKQDGARRGDFWSENALAFAERPAAGIEQHGLDAGAADVDGKSDRVCGGACGFGRGGFRCHQGE